jgi:hypothetical protein
MADTANAQPCPGECSVHPAQGPLCPASRCQSASLNSPGFSALKQPAILTRPAQSVNFIDGQFNATHSSVAQWQSIRLLTEGL